MRSTVAIVAAIAIGTGTAGFFAGTAYQKSKLPDFPARGNFTQMRDRTGNRINPATNPRGGAFGGGMTMGEVTAMDETSLTVKFRDGSSKIVILAGSTKYSKSTEAKVTELTIGENVAVFGTANADGSITAASIQINPEMRNLPQPIPTQ